MAATPKRLTHGDYTVAVICPMGVELAPVKAMLDHVHPDLAMQRELNSYTLGDMEGHNVAIAVLPEIGINAAATVATQLLNDFPAIRFGLLVGIGAGVPDEDDEGPDIRLGDVVVSKSTNTFGGVVQFDFGKALEGGSFERTGSLNKPPALLRATVEKLAANHRIEGSNVPTYMSAMLERYPGMQEEYSSPGQASDVLYRADYPHLGGKTCRNCENRFIVDRDERRSNNPKFHYGTIGSANLVVKDAVLRERLRREFDLLCIEMEAAGIMNDFPCLVIRGICDYADSHKNKKWQPYAAAAAAAYMKELLSMILPKDVDNVARAAAIIQSELDRRFYSRIRFLDSLKFADMNSRLNEIKPAEFETFQWIFRDETEVQNSERSLSDDETGSRISENIVEEETEPVGNYRSESELERLKAVVPLYEWFASNDVVFLLEGKAGSGKSTLMKFLFQHECTQSSLQKWSEGDTVKLMFHSFWLVGTREQNSFKGFMASLLHQLLSKCPELLEDCAQQDFSDTKSSFSDWSTEELSHLCYHCFGKTLGPVCLFLDGIDEFDQNDDFDRLFDFLDRLQDVDIQMKICLSSRPQQYIVDHFRGVPSLRLQDVTAQDIEKYICETLAAKLVRDYDNDDDIERDKIKDLVSALHEKANGVFIWVSLALQNVCRGIRIKDSYSDLARRIEKLPSAIEKLYSHMWLAQNLDNDIHFEEAARLFRTFRLFREEYEPSVPLIELISAMDQQLLDAYLANSQPLDKETFSKVCSNNADMYVARSAGLLECVNRDKHDGELIYHNSKDDADKIWALWGPRGPDLELDQTWRTTHVQFIHRSVDDFLTQTVEGRKISDSHGVELAALQDRVLLSRLVGFIEDLEGFTQGNVAPMLSRTFTYNGQEPSKVLRTIDQTCQSLIGHRAGKLSDKLMHWTMHLPMDKSHLIHDPFCLDFPGMLASNSQSAVLLSSLLESYGSKWSCYYKAYLLCAILSQYDAFPSQDSSVVKPYGAITDGSRLLELAQLLIESGAALNARHVNSATPIGFVHQTVAVQLLNVIMGAILDCYISFAHVAPMVKILEAIEQNAKKEEYLAVLLTAGGVWMYRRPNSDRWFLNTVLCPDPTTEFCRLVVFNPSQVYDAVHQTLCQSMESCHEYGFSICRTSDSLQRLLENIQKTTYTISRRKRGSGRKILCRKEEKSDSDWRSAWPKQARETDLSSQDWPQALPRATPGDLEDLRLSGLEFFEQTEQSWRLLPLNPYEELGDNEWKEKGVLRDYYAKLEEGRGKMQDLSLDGDHGHREERSVHETLKASDDEHGRPSLTTRCEEGDLQDIDSGESNDRRKRRRRGRHSVRG